MGMGKGGEGGKEGDKTGKGKGPQTKNAGVGSVAGPFNHWLCSMLHITSGCARLALLLAEMEDEVVVEVEVEVEVVRCSCCGVGLLAQHAQQHHTRPF